MQVTTEDGGRLNAFAKEPRMEVMDAETSRIRGRGSMLMTLGGTVLVLALVAMTVAIS
ncbi:high ligh-induced protein family [Synechococcus sp. A15-127]|uniref:photosystem II assembly protein Psb34 n=1 Tax=Synechococcus sp. A15-127 TaxID=1050624 RepID=UPI0016485421|nr:ssl1498 family light-harvesting-like protein [Synechococcus sp. A15-127]QNI93174.1 high ligh-induced protein family [Synechococcus sp. A15-127]